MTSCNRCGKREGVKSVREICQTCDDVLVCQDCFDLHVVEIATETGVYRTISPAERPGYFPK